MTDDDPTVFDTPEELESFLREHLPKQTPPEPEPAQVRRWIDDELEKLSLDELSYFHELLLILRHPTPAGLYHLAQEIRSRMEVLLEGRGEASER